jgi:hypothetical protein
MTGHLIDGKERHTDFIIPVLVSVFTFMNFADPLYFYFVLLTCLLVRILILVYRAFSVLGVYWVWQNARV